MAGSTLVTGAHILCYVNGALYGKVSSFSWKSTTSRKEIRGIDSVFIQELAPTVVSISGTMTVYRQLQDGGLEGAGMTSRFENLPREKHFSLTLIDRVSNAVVFQASQCSVDDQSWSIAPKGFLIGQVSFRAIEWANEVQPETR